MATATSNMEHTIVPPAEWLAARKELLRKEKEFTRLRDELSRQRRELPWESVEKEYIFEGPKGKISLWLEGAILDKLRKEGIDPDA